MSIDDYHDSEIKQLRSALLEILLKIDGFCKENNITYFIDSGTALGAKRHNGFIPWDDDIDLGMKREDYDRFLLLAQTQFPDGYSIHTFDNTDGFAPMFAKVCKNGTIFETEETKDSGFKQGIFIDIFPYDLLSSNEKERKKQLSRANLWQKISYLYCSPHVVLPVGGIAKVVAKGLCYMVHYVLRVLLSREVIKKKFDAATGFKGKPSCEMAILAYPNSGPFPIDMMIPPQNLTFEGLLFPAPNNIEGYLETVYGPTWTDLPPVEKRRSHRPIKLVIG